MLECQSQHAPPKPTPPPLPTFPLHEQAPVSGFGDAQPQIEKPSTKFGLTRPCKFCGNPVAANAKSCPMCGGKSPYPVSMKEGLIGVGGLFLLVFTCALVPTRLFKFVNCKR